MTFQPVPGAGENPHGSPLEQRLVVSWRRWERDKENREKVMDKEAILAAFCEGEEMKTNRLHDRITNARRSGLSVEVAVRLGVIGLNVDVEMEDE